MRRVWAVSRLWEGMVHILWNETNLFWPLFLPQILRCACCCTWHSVFFSLQLWGSFRSLASISHFLVFLAIVSRTYLELSSKNLTLVRVLWCPPLTTNASRDWEWGQKNKRPAVLIKPLQVHVTFWDFDKAKIIPVNV